MAEDNYDYEGYEKSLERSLSLAEKDYWSQYLDVNRHQVNVAKTYLWVAVALLGSYAAVIGKYTQYFVSNNCVAVVGLLSIVSAVIAFGICLYAIPARKGYVAIPVVSWGEFPTLANQSLANKDKRVYITLLTDLNNKVDKANHHNVSTNQKRAALLRLTSWVLIFSFSLAVLTGISVIFPITFSNHTQHMEFKMPEDNQSQNQPQEQQTETHPDVPTPAGPITGGNPDMSTHSENVPNTVNIRITESDASGHTEKK